MKNLALSLVGAALALVAGLSLAEDAATVPAEASANTVAETATANGPAKLDTEKVIDTDTAATADAEPPKPDKTSQQAASAKVSNKKTTATAVTPAQPAYGTVSDGSRISVDDKGFSIIAPEGWNIRRDLPRTSLYLQAANAIDDYVRNIGVVKFTGPKVINEITAEEFSTYLVKNFPAASPEITDYQLRNHQPVQMTDGREGILFYTDFKVRGRAMMQAHILLSSETHHYLATFTDLAEHFENPTSNTGFLAEAWESMISMELNSPNPKPLEEAQNTFLYIGIAAILGVAFVVWRNRVAGRMYSDYGAMEPGEALEVDPKTNALEDDSMPTNTNVSELHGAPTTNMTNAKVFSFRTKKTDHKGKGDEVSSEAVIEPDSKQSDFGEDDELPKDQWKVS